MNYGIDYKAAGNYSKVILDEHPNEWGAGGFTKIDGFIDSIPTFEKLIKTGRLTFIRYDLSWNDNHKYGSEYKSIVKREALRIRKLLTYPIKHYVNPVTEHELDERRWMEFAEIVNSALSGLNYELVNVPNGNKGFISSRYLNEFHGGTQKPRGARYAFSFDGTNCVDANVEQYKANYCNAEYFMWWNCQCNGRMNVNDKTPRPRRKAYPTSNQIDSWIYLKNDKGETKIPKDWIYKSHSDQHSAPPQGKDQKPVWVKLPKFKAIELRARNGQIISKAPYYGTYEGGGHRYYHSEWGYLIAEKCKRIQKDCLCEVWADGKKYGVINPAFRDGVYR